MYCLIGKKIRRGYKSSKNNFNGINQSPTVGLVTIYLNNAAGSTLFCMSKKGKTLITPTSQSALIDYSEFMTRRI